MDSEAIKQLIEKARKNPKFFHTLVFDPEKALGELGLVDRKSKAALFAIEPEQFLAQLLSVADRMCSTTCASSCDSTCGRGSCSITCRGDSCGYTCGARSCADTRLLAPESGPASG